MFLAHATEKLLFQKKIMNRKIQTNSASHEIHLVHNFHAAEKAGEGAQYPLTPSNSRSFLG